MTRMVMAMLLMAAATARGLAADCTQQTLTVEGRAVTIGYCIAGPARSNGTAEVIVPVIASFSSPNGALRRDGELHFLAGERVSRVIESLDLSKIGLTGTLHLTLTYERGLVRVEGALLTPGAITIL